MFNIKPYRTWGQVTQHNVIFDKKPVSVSEFIQDILDVYRDTNIDVRILVRDVAYVQMNKGHVVCNEMDNVDSVSFVSSCYATSFQNQIMFVVDKLHSLS